MASKGRTMEQNWKVINEYGVAHTNENGSQLKIAEVSWYDKESKLEIRRWNKDGVPGKGLTLSPEEFMSLKKFFDTLDVEVDEVESEAA